MVFRALELHIWLHESVLVDSKNLGNNGISQGDDPAERAAVAMRKTYRISLICLDTLLAFCSI